MQALVSKSLIVIGASGVGKGTLIGELRHRHPHLFGLVLSFTTRAMRPGESHGINYLYVSAREFQHKIPQMLEHKLVHRNWYGTSHQHLLSLQAQNKIPVLDIDIEGMLEIRHKINCEVLCVMPPSWAVLRDRLQCRGTQTHEVVEARMRDNASQIQKMLTLRGTPGIHFVTNYQYQLTVYGIEQWLMQHFELFRYGRAASHTKVQIAQ